jgi:chromosome segregation ATPase
MSKTKSNPSAAQGIEQLQKRFNELQHAKTRAETNRDNAQKRLDELRSEAREKFGTDDLNQLQSQLERLKLENEKKRSDYEKELDKVEQKLAEIEEKFVDLDDSSAEPMEIQSYNDE